MILKEVLQRYYVMEFDLGDGQVLWCVPFDDPDPVPSSSRGGLQNRELLPIGIEGTFRVIMKNVLDRFYVMELGDLGDGKEFWYVPFDWPKPEM